MTKHLFSFRNAKKFLLIIAALWATTTVRATRIDYTGPTRGDDALSSVVYLSGDGYNAVCWCYDEDMTAEYQVISYTLDKELNIIIPNTVSKNEKTYTITDVLAFMSDKVVSVSLPAGLKKLRAHILEGEPVTSIEIPASVDSIGDYAFYGCSQLSSLMLNNNLRFIGDYSFLGTKLNPLIIPVSVEQIGVGAFQNCAITSLTLNEGLTTIGGAAFADNNIESVTLPSTLNTIGVGAFGSNKISEIVIPDAVTSLGEQAFSYCPLKSITFGGGVKVLEPIVFFGSLSDLETLVVREGVEEISSAAFESCYKLANLTLPLSLKRIGEHAFYSTAITSLTTSASIAARAFESCEQLTAVTLVGGAEYIGERAFRYDTKLKEITVTSSLKSIGEIAFEGCDMLKKAHLGEQLLTIGDNAFYSCNALSDVKIPETVEEIGEYAFFYTSIRELKAAANVGKGAFKDCDSLRSVILLDGAKTIGEAAFYHADSLKTVIFPNTLESIGEDAFSQAVSIKNITLPKSLNKLGKGAFYWCVQAEQIILSNLVDTIPEQAFAYCGTYTQKIGELRIPNSVKVVADEAFIGLPIFKLTIGERVDSIGSQAFANCEKISSIIAYPETAPRTADNAFDYVPTTAVVTVPCSALESYRAEWSHFTNFIGVVAIQGLPEDEMKGKVTVTFSGDCANSVAVLYAEANEGYEFDHWSDGNKENPRVITSTESQTFIAYFKNQEEGINEVLSDQVSNSNARKILIEGKLFIAMPDGQIFNANGERVR